MIAQVCRTFINIGFSSILSFTVVFGIVADSSSAEQLFTQRVNFYHAPIATIEKVNAITQDLEGKAQEAIGNVMGDVKNQVAGKVKQASSAVVNASEDLKDKAQMPERMQSGAKDLEGKAQEAIGKVTGDRQDQAVGKAKQMESSTRSWLEDVKDTVNGLFK